MPAELDVPHWAVAEVARFRQVNKPPAWVTDRMIFAAMTLIDNDEEAKQRALRDAAICIHLVQAKELEDAPVK